MSHSSSQPDEPANNVSYFLTTDINTEPGVVTAEMIRSAIANLENEDMEQAIGHAHHAAALMEATPEHLRSHPFVVALATAIGNGAIFHPRDAAEARVKWESLCRGEWT